MVLFAHLSPRHQADGSWYHSNEVQVYIKSLEKRRVHELSKVSRSTTSATVEVRKKIRGRWRKWQILVELAVQTVTKWWQPCSLKHVRVLWRVLYPEGTQYVYAAERSSWTHGLHRSQKNRRITLREVFFAENVAYIIIWYSKNEEVGCKICYDGGKSYLLA